MNRDDIIRMAREASLFVPQAGIPENGALTRFAAAEREACAKVCEEPGWNAANWCAKAIRARSNT